MEVLLEARRREMEALHERVAAAEVARAAAEERARPLDALEAERARLERELGEAAVRARQLQRAAEREHAARAALEERSLAAARAARERWEEARGAERAAARAEAARLAGDAAALRGAAQQQAARLAAAAADLQRSQRQLEELQLLQKDHKDSMAKARRLTRQSIASAGGQRELAEVQRELAETQRDLTCARDTEQNLRVELEERKKDYAHLKKQEERIPRLEARLREAESNKERRGKEGERERARVEREREQGEKEIEALQRRVEELEFTVCSLESDALEWHGEETTLRKRLTTVGQQEDKYRNKVAELEDLLTKLQGEVARLETDKRRADIEATNDKKVEKKEEAKFFEERIAAVEKQLKASHEESALLKQEARKASSALWKKEKELADCDLDRRIACRELKQATEKLRVGEQEREAAEARRVALQAELGGMRERAAQAEEALREAGDARAKLDKLEAEHDRCRNDIMKLKGELQYSENRRLKAEGAGSGSETERARLQEALLQRDSQLAALDANHRLLQGACTMLEDQLLDFERLTQLQEATNERLQDERDKLDEECQELRRELGEERVRLESVQRECEGAIVQHQDAMHTTRQQRERHLDLEKQLDELLNRECSLRTDLENATARGEAAAEGRARAESAVGTLRSQLAALGDELRTLRSAQAREQLTLGARAQEAEAAAEGLRELLREMEAQAAHWRQRELKAEDTIRQHLKLIDFLQTKVEEANKKKRGLGELLFGSRSASKENAPPPSPAPSPCVLRERNDGTPRRPRPLTAPQERKASPPRERKASPDRDQPLMEGWVRVEKEGLLQRVYMELRGLQLRRRGFGDTALEGARLISDLQPPACAPLLLSQQECENAFKLELPHSSPLVVVCPSSGQRQDWLSALKEAGLKVRDSAPVVTWGRELLQASQLHATCLLELDADACVIGTQRGLSSWVRGRDGAPNLGCWEGGGVSAALVAATVDCCILQPISGAAPVTLSLRQLKCAVRALPASRPTLAPVSIPLILEPSEKCLHMRICTRRAILGVATSRSIYILTQKADSWTVGQRVALPGPARSLVLAPHTALLAAPAPLELDLRTLELEEFLDPSDPGLSSTRRLVPMDLLAVGERAGDSEYLLCYPEMGVFVDSYGRRSRPQNILWERSPKKFAFRKPFLFAFHTTGIDILRLEESSFGCEGADSESVSSSTASPESILIYLSSPTFLGNSSAAGCVYVSVVTPCGTQILELYGGEGFGDDIRMSTETLDSEGTDSVTPYEEDVPSLCLSLQDSPVQSRTDFASHIREKAKLLSAIKNEKNKVNAISHALAGSGRSSDTESSSGEDSEKQVRFIHH